MDIDSANMSMNAIPFAILSEEHPIGALITPSRLHLLRHVDSHRTSHKELFGALAERWWATTDTFHFGWGEMTMTPADFSAISGIPFGFRPLDFYSDWRRDIPSARMIELIGIDLPRDRRCVSRTWLASSAPTVYAGCEGGTISAAQGARFVILLLLASTFYANRKQAVDPGILRSLEDLSLPDQYDWAGAMLSRLYEDMSD